MVDIGKKLHGEYSDMKVIRFYGALAKKFGKVHYLDVTTVQEGLYALSRMLGGYKEYMQTTGKDIQYAIFLGSQQLLKTELGRPFSEQEEVRVIPMIQGSGDIFRVILGITIIAFLGPWSSIGGTALFGTTVGAIATSIGTSLILGGLGSALFGSGSPELQDQSTYETENRPSYAFNGPVNTVKQGNPVPIGYGRLLVGSQVISAGLDSVPTSG